MYENQSALSKCSEQMPLDNEQTC